MALWSAFKFRPRVYRNIEDTHASSTCLGTVPFIPSMLLFPSQRRPFYFHGYLIHTRLYIVDGRYASCPQHGFVGICTSDDYLQATGGAYYNLHSYVLVTSFRECGGAV